jgi:hypothetical protein
MPSKRIIKKSKETLKLVASNDNITVATMIHQIMQCGTDEISDQDADKVVAVSDNSYALGYIRGLEVGERSMMILNQKHCLN